MKKYAFLVSLVLVLAMLVSACGAAATPTAAPAGPTATPVVVTKVVTATPAPPAPPTATVKPARANVIRINNGIGDTPTLDPNVAEDTSSITVIENAFIGLTRLDEVTSALNPGMATELEHLRRRQDLHLQASRQRALGQV